MEEKNVRIFMSNSINFRNVLSTSSIVRFVEDGVILFGTIATTIYKTTFTSVTLFVYITNSITTVLERASAIGKVRIDIPRINFCPIKTYRS